MEIKRRTEYYGGAVLGETEAYILTHPQNPWDMNYHLYNIYTGTEYLIDIGDVQDKEEDVDEYGGILFSSLIELSDMDSIMEVVWKTIQR